VENRVKTQRWFLALTFALLVLPGAAFAHGTGKHVMGTATAVEADRLEVTTKEGKNVTVRLTPETKFKPSGTGTATRPQVGDRVAAEVVEKGDAFTAVEVRFATSQPKK
jgi:exosome complex RNA-binding protein Csl4